MRGEILKLHERGLATREGEFYENLRWKFVKWLIVIFARWNSKKHVFEQDKKYIFRQ